MLLRIRMQNTVQNLMLNMSAIHMEACCPVVLNHFHNFTVADLFGIEMGRGKVGEDRVEETTSVLKMLYNMLCFIYHSKFSFFKPQNVHLFSGIINCH